MVIKEIFDDYADKIWSNEYYIAKDRIRWHTSNYHIESCQLTIEDVIADAHECLDITPEEIGISLSIEEWQKNCINNPKMISAMAKIIYHNLKKYGRYAFKHNPNWDVVARRYIKDYLQS